MLPEASATFSNSPVLSAFPLEVLSVLATFISGRDIALLWNCGCSRLNTNLGARGAVRKFSLELDPLFPSKWPSIINNLPHVSEVCIFASVHTTSSLNYGSFRLLTPPALRALSLVFGGSLTAFLKSCRLSGGSDFSTLETLRATDPQVHLSKDDAHTLKSLKSLTSLNLEFSSYRGAMSDFLPPNLTCLILNMETCKTLDLNLPKPLLTFSCMTRKCDTTRDPLAFPPGLTELCFLGRYKEFTAAEIALLPPTLTHLSVRVDLKSEATRNALPSALQTLRLPFMPTGTNDNLAHYPRNLTYMNGHAAITIENVEFLPPRLTALSALTPDLRIVPKLPPSLTSLQFSSSTGPKISGSMEPVALPKSLKELEDIPTSLLSRCTLPVTLKYLLATGPNFSSKHTRVLPVGLENLAIESFDSDTLLGLPRGLTTLSARNLSGSIKPRITLELASQLPSTLTSLELRFVELESAEVLYKLPSGLEKLYLSVRTLETSIDLRKAPSSLKYFSLTVNAYQQGLCHAILTTLPRKLQVFFFSLLPQIALTDVQEEALHQLPPSLVLLSIPESTVLRAIRDRPSYLPLHLKTVKSGIRDLWDK